MIQLLKGDCLELMKDIPTGSIDMILADPPFGTTNCSWDSVIPLNEYVISSDGILFEDFSKFFNSYFRKGYDYCISYWIENKKPGLWNHYNRIIKSNGAILLFAQTPFDKVLGASNLNLLRYEWIWEKTQATGHLNAKKMPMKAHENILVFYKKLPTYNPQKTQGHVRKVSSAKNRAACIDRRNGTDTVYNDEYPELATDYDSTERYPRSVLKFPTDKQKLALHPTQKPVALLEYLIKTYTNEGELVLDNCMGSGSTGVAAKNLDRSFIGMEKDEKYFEIAKNRI